MLLQTDSRSMPRPSMRRHKQLQTPLAKPTTAGLPSLTPFKTLNGCLSGRLSSGLRSWQYDKKEVTM